ncbi:PEP-CTERM sorting domain-containing protein [Fuerstiella marisgermanici]|uniref:PEP-CTERM motif n=1 Tax=Fuerstiella marisgermanici TaxID=1891926 RepID=A0A1P8WBD1_9PLAN|nr:PEP-CTERM sorting domain-containing protein [Fuerstiella marisgermanici]APZ91333.1 PEP-CTERM motif [Fuerstiella marisgermanici]
MYSTLRSAAGAAVTASFLLASSHLHADIIWNASSGQTPTGTDPLWLQVDDEDDFDPVIGSSGGINHMTLQTDSEGMPTNTSRMYFQRLPATLPLEAGRDLVVEFEMQLVSGTSFLPASRAPATVAINVAAGAAMYLNFTETGIAFQQSQTSFFDQAAINTSDFHQYRLEIDHEAGAGGDVLLYQDGILVQTSSLRNQPSFFGTQPRVWFGEGTNAAFGESNWRSFSVTAAVPEPSSYALLAGATIVFGWRRRKRLSSRSLR